MRRIKFRRNRGEHSFPSFKFLRRLAQEIGVSNGAAWIGTHLSRVWPLRSRTSCSLVVLWPAFTSGIRCFQRTWLRVGIFFRQDDVYSESKYSVWARICLGVGYVSEPIGNTCRTFCNVSRYTALHDVTPLSLWRQLTEQETWQSTMCSHTAEAVHRFSRQILFLRHSWQCLDTLPLRLFDRFCSLLSSAAMSLTSIYIQRHIHRVTQIVWPTFGRLLLR